MLMHLLLEIKDKISSRKPINKIQHRMCKIGIREAKSYLKSGSYSASHLSVTASSELLRSLNSPGCLPAYVVFWFGFAVEMNFPRQKVFIVPVFFFCCQCVGGHCALF